MNAIWMHHNTYTAYFHSDSVSDEVIGSHFIDLSAISNDGANGKHGSMFTKCMVITFPHPRTHGLWSVRETSLGTRLAFPMYSTALK
jgi:hypothetical protein